MENTANLNIEGLNDISLTANNNTIVYNSIHCYVNTNVLNNIIKLLKDRLNTPMSEIIEIWNELWLKKILTGW